MRPAAEPPTGRLAWGIEATGAHSVTAGNVVELRGRTHGGIRVAGKHLRVEENEVAGVGREDEGPPALGILVGPGQEIRVDEACVVRANHVVNVDYSIVVRGDRGLPSREIQVLDNIITVDERSQLTGGYGIVLEAVSFSTVSRNSVTGSGLGLAICTGTSIRCSRIP